MVVLLVTVWSTRSPLFRLIRQAWRQWQGGRARRMMDGTHRTKKMRARCTYTLRPHICCVRCWRGGHKTAVQAGNIYKLQAQNASITGRCPLTYRLGQVNQGKTTRRKSQQAGSSGPEKIP